jgi:molecular chaperone GrpE
LRAVSIEDNKPAAGDPSLGLDAETSPSPAGSAETPEGVEILIPEEYSNVPEIEALKEKVGASEEKVKDLSEKLKESHERLLRAAADLENFRKRWVKEKEEIQRYGIEKVLKDFLPIQDNLERALEHAKNGDDFDSLRQGIGMTRKLFEDSLARHGVRSFTSVGRPFDPRLHEALQQVPSRDQAPNHVISEVVKGYLLHDRLARPALVIVSKGVTESSDESEAPDATPVEAEQAQPGVSTTHQKTESS